MVGPERDDQKQRDNACSDTDAATLNTVNPPAGTVNGMVNIETTVGVEPGANMTTMRVNITGSVDGCNVANGVMVWNSPTANRWNYSWNTSPCGTASADTNVNIDVTGTDPDCGGSAKAASTVQVDIDNSLAAFTQFNDFEAGVGDWDLAATGDDFDWTRRSGATGSTGTGPNDDYSGAGGFYVFTETSDPNNPSMVFDLENTTTFNGGTHGNLEVRFYHNLTGNAIGTLEVIVCYPTNADCTNPNSVWSITGPQDTQYSPTGIPVSVASPKPLSVVPGGPSKCQGAAMASGADSITTIPVCTT